MNSLEYGIIFLIIFSTLGYFILASSHPLEKKVYQTERRILTEWDRGYPAEVISGYDAVSTAGGIDREVHNLFWLSEKEAAAGLIDNGVDYVLMTSEHFNILKSESGQYFYSVAGAFVYESEMIPPISNISFTTLYKLRFSQNNPEYFELVWNKTDEATGLEVFIYKIVGRDE